jgi:hypothetical protein
MSHRYWPVAADSGADFGTAFNWNEIYSSEFECANQVGVPDDAISFCSGGNSAGGHLASASHGAKRNPQLLRTLCLLSSARQWPYRCASYAAVWHASSRDRSENWPERHGAHQRSRPIRPASRARCVAKRSARARHDEPRRHFCSSRSAVRHRVVPRIRCRVQRPSSARPAKAGTQLLYN